MNFIVIILIFSFSFSQNHIMMNPDPLVKNKITVSNVLTLDGGDLGYYNGIDVRYYQKQYFVYDKGNHIFFIYDLNGNKQLEFGSEGNGPGEFSQFAQLYDVDHNRIMMRQFDRLSLFTLDGKFINDIKIRSFDYSIELNKTQIILTALPDKNIKSFVYDIDGKLIKEIEKRDKDKEEERPFFNLDDTNQMIGLVLKPSIWVKYGDHYVRHSKLEYRIDIANSDGEISKTLSRSFDRIKLELPDDWKIISVGDSKKDAELNGKLKQKFIDAKNGFESDVMAVLGYFNGYLLIQVASENDNKMIVDVIKDDQFVSQFEVPVPNGSSENSLRLSKDKLIAYFKTDESGPFSEVYEMSIN